MPKQTIRVDDCECVNCGHIFDGSDACNGDKTQESIFKGFCFDKTGRYTPAVTLKGTQAVMNYCKLQGELHYEVRITDETENDTVMQVINGFVVWPENIKGMHIRKL